MTTTTKTTTNDERPSWDATWLEVAKVISKRSRCSRARYCAVIVSKQQRICATGYNGPAATWPEPDECIHWCERAQGLAPLDNLYDQCPAIHAEANALLYVDRSSIEGGTIYVTGVPCMQCAKLISNSGLRRVVCTYGPSDEHRRPQMVFDYLETCRIELVIVKEDDNGDS